MEKRNLGRDMQRTVQTLGNLTIGVIEEMKSFLFTTVEEGRMRKYLYKGVTPRQPDLQSQIDISSQNRNSPNGS